MPENPKSIVTTGFSNIHVALYAADGGNVTYTGVRKLGRSVSMSTDISTSDDNNFYADDRLAETETGSAFTDGSGTMTIDGLTGTGMHWDENGMISKAPAAVVIENGVYVPMG